MEKRTIVAIFAISACLAAAVPIATNQVGILVTDIVTKADAGDTAYFAAHMGPHYLGQETNLVEMIKRSGMATNYTERLTLNTNGTGRLNYHYLERGCHFQIDITMTNDSWTIRQILFCR